MRHPVAMFPIAEAGYDVRSDRHDDTLEKR